jgi:hypothetical protein
MSSESNANWESEEGDRIIGSGGEAASDLKSVIDRRWDAIVADEE